MNKAPLRIAIAGASGRMGRQLVREVKKSNQVIVGAALTRANTGLYGVDVGKLAGVGTLNVKFNDDLAAVKEDFDILIDFTQPETTLEYLDFCLGHNKGMVIGTTGFSKVQKVAIEEAARQIGVVFSANFSVSINLMLKLLEKTAQVIGEFTDIEIIETHHRYKFDTPSGTALVMGEVIANATGRDLASCAVYGREKQHTDERKANSIGFTTVRAGDIIGEHTVMFADVGERLEISHKASSRMIFARGAIRAAVWLGKEKIGLFNMVNVLGLDEL